MYLRKNLMRIISFVLCIALIFPRAVYAGQSANDYSNHWAGKRIQRFVDRGLISLYKDGNFKPDAPITRAEFAAMANKVFNFSGKSTKSFKDIKLGDAYYNDMLIANKAGYMTGNSDGKLLPKSFMTYQDFVVIILKLIKLDIKKYGVLAEIFSDTGAMSEWSEDVFGDAASLNKLSPKGYITRGQAVAVLYEFYRENVKVAYNKPGIYSVKTVNGNIAINVPNVTLQNTTINGDLIIGNGVGKGKVKLLNVVVKGETIVRGGGLSSIIIEDSKLTNIVVKKADNSVGIVAVGKTTIDSVDMQSGGKLEEQCKNGGGISYVKIAEGVDVDETVILKGNFKSVLVQSEEINLNVEAGSIMQLNVDQTAENTKINLSTGANVRNMLISAAVLVTGTGSILTVQVNVQGVCIAVPTTIINTAKGVVVATNISDISEPLIEDSSSDGENSSNIPTIVALGSISAIIGTPKVGVELIAGSLSPSGATVNYQWKICNTLDGTYTSITGATTGKYKPTIGDIGKFIKVSATGTGRYTGTVTSEAVGAVVVSEQSAACIEFSEPDFNTTATGSLVIVTDEDGAQENMFIVDLSDWTGETVEELAVEIRTATNSFGAQLQDHPLGGIVSITNAGTLKIETKKLGSDAFITAYAIGDSEFDISSVCFMTGMLRGQLSLGAKLDAKRSMNPNIKVLNPTNMHITLQGLGTRETFTYSIPVEDYNPDSNPSINDLISFILYNVKYNEMASLSENRSFNSLVRLGVSGNKLSISNVWWPSSYGIEFIDVSFESASAVDAWNASRLFGFEIGLSGYGK